MLPAVHSPILGGELRSSTIEGHNVMGKAFTRLVNQVNGRHSSRPRVVPFQVRLAELEKATLELMAYLTVEVANDPQSSSDAALTAAYVEYKKHLEGTVV